MKRTVVRVVTVVFTVLALACRPAPPDPFAGTVVDLSHAYDEQTVYWPTAEKTFKLEKDFEGVTDRGLLLRREQLLDRRARRHAHRRAHPLRRGANTADRIPLEQLMGAGVVVDVSREVRARRRLSDHGRRLRRVGARARRAPARRRSSSCARASGSAGPTASVTWARTSAAPRPSRNYTSPASTPTPRAGSSRDRAVKAVGLDTPSIDYGQSTLFESHRILFERDIPAFENLANLDRLPPRKLPRHRAADEDQGRQRRPPARRRHSQLNTED